MNLFAAYLFGVIGATIFRWSLWKTPEKQWRDYLKTDAGPMLASAVFAFICYGLWIQGWLSRWANNLHEGLNIPIEWWSTVPAAALIDYFAVEFVEWLGSWVRNKRRKPEGD